MKLLHSDAALSAVQSKFLTTRQELSSTLIERDEEIDIVLTSLLCQEHPLLIGPPGSGKSLLLDSLLTWMHGNRFSILLTKFSVPEELFGPISVVGLKEDRYERITTGKLPQADLAFVDEIFKASSAILNTLLRILNERTFEKGDGTAVKVPLKMCVAASNEWPHSQDGGKEMNALFDRFLLRKSVRPILSASGRQRLLWDRDHTPELSTTITPAELEEAHNSVKKVFWTTAAKEAMGTILQELSKEGIQPGDRRQYKSVTAAQAFAYLHGSDRVEPDHLEILAHILWDDPVEQPEKVAQIIARIANPTSMRVNQLLLEVEQILNMTDVKQLAQAATATTKLQEIDKQLTGLKGNDRVEKARLYVKGQIKKVRLGSMDAI
jgi:MoxR-like ATPase